MLKTKQNRWKQLAKDLKLGVILYRIYYAPIGFIKLNLRWGLINSILANKGKTEMEKAVFKLKPIESHSLIEPLDIYFLTGKKYWYQTCFCAYSMIQQSQTNIRPIIYDDGTLESQHEDEITRIFPNAKIIWLEDIEARLDEHLPINKFPFLRERRLQQPLIRKLTDFHAGSQGWKLFLDSDMLFFHTPTYLIDWLKSPQKPCYMVDVKNAYGYSNDLMLELAGAEIPDLVNIGIFGLKSEELDWEKFEFWVKTLLEKEGTHYNITQALSSMYLANKNCAITPAQEYIVMPEREEAMNPKAVLHHYVADSKPWYFRYGWKYIIKNDT